MSEAEVFKKLVQAVINGDEEEAKKAAEGVVASGLDPVKAIKEAGKGMAQVGKDFHDFKVFLPEVMLAADAMKAAVTILEKKIPKERLKETVSGKIVIGTCYGDIHDIGKNIVAAMFSAGGFDVYDIGVGVPPKVFLGKAGEIGADIIAMSALLTPSLPFQRDLVKDLEDMGIREKYFLIIGGGATYPSWAEEIGVDGWGLHAEDGVRICMDFMTGRIVPPLPKPRLEGREK